MRLERGLYELPTTRAVSAALAGHPAALVELADVDPAEAPALLGRHVGRLVERALRAVPGASDAERRAGQAALVNALVEQLEGLAPRALAAGADRLADPAVLKALLEPAVPPALPRHPRHPEIPLGASALLVNGRDEPRIGTAVRSELESADAVDLLCAFVKWHGLRVVEEALSDAIARGIAVRVLTTTYMGATERKALDRLVELGADVRVSYDTRTTRLHAKAWLFHRRSGFATAYIGSSNLSRTALLEGLEWNVRLAAAEQPHLIETITATFENHWRDGGFEPYDPARDRDRFDDAIAAERGTRPVDATVLLGLDVRPYPFQQEILDSLEAERVIHARWHNLVVAATGTGKTVLAALDYQRLRASGLVDSLLFVAHRRELLEQSLSTFRSVLRDGAFGELFVGGDRPDRWTHVFASVQSLSRLDLDAVAADRWSMVVVDEFHHAEAPTYSRLLDHLRPRVLLGLTATPERTDGRDVRRWFDGRFAAELRLWEAVDRGLLCPFQYFGVADDTDLSAVQWRRGGYATEELERVYTGDDARVRKVVQALRNTVADLASMRALGFCVSVAHAEYMSRRFNDHGIAAIAVSGETAPDVRADALRALRDRRLNIVFAVDLFNEGVDVPELDTVLFLRPTESATVFLQQLGRGLRLAPDKPCLTVLDFIGNQHAKFRFDLRYRALTGVPRGELREQIEAGFPYLPSGCHVELDRVAASTVIANVTRALRVPWRDLVRELREMGDVPLATFLERAGLDLADLYRQRDQGWTDLRRQAGFERRPAGPDDAVLGRAMKRFVHVDDAERIRAYVQLLSARAGVMAAEGRGRGARLEAMLHHALWTSALPVAEADRALGRVHAEPARREELVELLELRADQLERVTSPVQPRGALPLHVHGHYSRDEALAAFGDTSIASMRQGVRYYPDERADVFFITLRKTERHYSPTTRYADYALAPDLFHWESQSTTSDDSPTGRRYIEHLARGSTVHLFIRETKTGGVAGAPPYLYAGTARYVSHKGSRPMQIVWKLDAPLPPELYVAAKVASA